MHSNYLHLHIYVIIVYNLSSPSFVWEFCIMIYLRYQARSSFITKLIKDAFSLTPLGPGIVDKLESR